MPSAVRLLAVHSGALGDVVLLCRLLGALRTEGVTATLVAAGEKARLMATLGAVDRAIDFNALPMGELFFDSPDGPSELAAKLGPCDHLISCFGAGDRAVEEKLAAACRAVSRDFLPIRPLPGDSRHVLDLWAEQMRLAAPVPAIAWSVPSAVELAAGKILAQAGVDPDAPYVALHIGSGSPDKCWPLERFAQLADRIEHPVVLLMGPPEHERLTPEAIDRLRSAGAVPADLTLEHLAGILAAAAAFVGNDSGPAHLAAGVGTPTLALFGPTDPAQFAPHGPSVQTVRHEPLEAMPVDQVAGVLATLLTPR